MVLWICGPVHSKLWVTLYIQLNLDSSSADSSRSWYSRYIGWLNITFFVSLHSYPCCGGYFHKSESPRSANFICTSGDSDLLKWSPRLWVTEVWLYYEIVAEGNRTPMVHSILAKILVVMGYTIVTSSAKKDLIAEKYHRPWSDAAHDARRLIRAYDICR